MNVYNAYSPCPKCRNSEISVRHNAVLNLMERRCVICGYKWDELPKDADTKKKGDFWQLLRPSKEKT